MLQGKCLRIVSRESLVKLYCCYGVIIVLTVAVVALSAALSGKWLTLQILWHSVHIQIVSYTYWVLWTRHCGKGSRENALEVPVLWELRFQQEDAVKEHTVGGVQRRPGSASLGRCHPASSRWDAGDIGPHWGTVQGRDQGEKNSKEEPQGRWGQRIIWPGRYSASPMTHGFSYQAQLHLKNIKWKFLK